MKEAFKLLWKESGANKQSVKDFLRSEYFRRNLNFFHYILNKTFPIGEHLPSIKNKLVGQRELKNIFAENERKVIELGLRSPTFINLLMNAGKSQLLEDWFITDNHNSALDYMRFVVGSCLIVDAFGTKEDLTPEIEENLALQFTSMHRIHMSHRMKKSKAEESKNKKLKYRKTQHLNISY
jgi:hypothetical protein